MLTIYIYPRAPVVRDSEFGVLQLLGVLIINERFRINVEKGSQSIKITVLQ